MFNKDINRTIHFLLCNNHHEQSILQHKCCIVALKKQLTLSRRKQQDKEFVPLGLCILIQSMARESPWSCRSKGQKRRIYSSAFLIKHICNYVSSFIAKYFCIISFYRLVDDNFDRSWIHYTLHSWRHDFACSNENNWYNWHSGFYRNAERAFLHILTARQK